MGSSNCIMRGGQADEPCVVHRSGEDSSRNSHCKTFAQAPKRALRPVSDDGTSSSDESCALNSIELHVLLLFSSNGRKSASLSLMILEAAREMLTLRGATACDIIDVGSLDLPVYSEACERTTFPAQAKELRAKVASADGLVIACPEFNGSRKTAEPPLFNTITWCTRKGGTIIPDAFEGKPVIMLSVAPGLEGPQRALGMRVLQQRLADVGSVVVESRHRACTFTFADNIFDGDGRLVDPQARIRLKTHCCKLMTFAVDRCMHSSSRNKSPHLRLTSTAFAKALVAEPKCYGASNCSEDANIITVPKLMSGSI